MYIVVVGAGKVGYHLTKSLMNEGQEVLVIEKDGTKVDRIMTQLGATAIQGDGSEVATMQMAGIERADVVAAVTGHDEDNLIVSQVAKRRFNVPRTVARINNPRNEHIFAQLGIDATVSATQIILSIIEQEIPEHPFVHLLTLQEGGVGFIQLQVSAESPAAGETMGNLTLPEDTAIPLLIRGGKPIVVHADTTLQVHDKLIAVATTQQESALRSYIG
ncbi:MAG: potassium channel family protein [Chloroflexota bacterium]|nr:MAG: portal protein [Chloroflexota bacterium]